jgi:putative restriction endonuclease
VINDGMLDIIAESAGFDGRGDDVGGFRAYLCSQAQLTAYLRAEASEVCVALSARHVARELGGYDGALSVGLPVGVSGCKRLGDDRQLYEELRRAIALARTLPTALLDEFLQKTKELPRSTEAERLVMQRVGQAVFRGGLLEYAGARCMVTGVTVPQFLRASHIKPWRDCATDAERLDVYNGLLLAVQWDAAFDQGFVTFGADGGVIVSQALSGEVAERLGLDLSLRVQGLRPEHHVYMGWHRERVFRRSGRDG